MKLRPVNNSAISSAFPFAPRTGVAPAGGKQGRCGRNLPLPLLLASSSLPRCNLLGKSNVPISRCTYVRRQVIADPNNVGIECTGAHEGEALEKELARHLTLSSSAQSDPAAVSSRTTSIELPPYVASKVQLKMPGVNVSAGIGMHVQGPDPQDPAVRNLGILPRERRLSWDLSMQERDIHISRTASGQPGMSHQEEQLSSSAASPPGPELKQTQSKSTSRAELWGMHERLYATEPQLSQLDAEASTSSSLASHPSSRGQEAASQLGERWAFDDWPQVAEQAAVQETGAASTAPAGYASRGVTSSHVASPGSALKAGIAASGAVRPLAPIDHASASSSAPEIPKAIMVISLVSASLTLASCVFNTLLPIYMVVELKMTMRSMGMFEGLLEAFSYVVRMFSGVVSDMMTSRKSAITLGFAMGAMAKFGMSGASTVGTLFACKAIDRLANGVQAAPRDALISDLAPDSSRSACFGYAQSLRKWGSAVGAVMVYFLMKASGNNYQLIFTMAASVSLASCAAFVLLVPSHIRPQRPSQPSTGQDGAASQPSGFQWAQFWKDVACMGPDFYRMLSIIFLLGMGHINESLLEARAIEVGFGKAESTLVVATLALVISVVAYPLGRLDDKFGPRVTFAIGMAALIAADLVLMMSSHHPMAVFVSLLFMGVHMGVLQGPLLSIVVGLAPGHLRGTAFGIFYTVMAVTALAANSMFGAVWYSCGATSAFGLSAALTTMTLLALPWLLPNRPLVPAAAT